MSHLGTGFNWLFNHLGTGFKHKYNILICVPNCSKSQLKPVPKCIYDVILFWGRSNMVGYCGANSNERNVDGRYDYTDEDSIKEISEKTGIDQEILRNNSTMNYVSIEQTQGTVYEYKYKNDKDEDVKTNPLVEITKDTKNIGETITDLTDETTNTASRESYGTNLVPQFCKTYYEEMEHKVIVVHASLGSQKLVNFLPSSDPDYEGDKHIYDTIMIKYNVATEYLEKNNYNIGNKLYVMYQGEDDVKEIVDYAVIIQDNKDTVDDAKITEKIDAYKQNPKKINDYLKEDTGIQKGVIIKNATKIERVIIIQ